MPEIVYVPGPTSYGRLSQFPSLRGDRDYRWLLPQAGRMWLWAACWRSQRPQRRARISPLPRGPADAYGFAVTAIHYELMDPVTGLE